MGFQWRLTLAVYAPLVDTCAHHHHVVNDGEAALAANPLSLGILHAAVRQHGRLVLRHSLSVEFADVRELLFVEELPCRTIDDIIGGVAEDVDDGVGSVENARIVLEAYGMISRDLWLRR